MVVLEDILLTTHSADGHRYFPGKSLLCNPSGRLRRESSLE